jgi:DNA-binding Xre family transcriptional regulator
MSENKATINKPTTVTTFEDYVMNNLTAAEYKQLPTRMGMSQYSVTRMFSRTKRMSLEQIEKISKILNKHPYELISHYKLGYEVVTLDEMEQIARGYNT